jgi:hypothetical protein
MNEQTASLIIRQNIALGDEGIGPARREVDGQWADDSAADNLVIAEAVRVAGHLFSEYQLVESGLISD